MVKKFKQFRILMNLLVPFVKLEQYRTYECATQSLQNIVYSCGWIWQVLIVFHLLVFFIIDVQFS